MTNGTRTCVGEPLNCPREKLHISFVIVDKVRKVIRDKLKIFCPI